MPKNRSLFQDNWLGEDRFKDWVGKKNNVRTVGKILALVT